MKRCATVLLAGLLTALPATPESVEVLELHPSSEKPVIAVLKDGTPQQGVTLVVFANNGKQKLTLTTDSRGAAKLPQLYPGVYCLAASTSPTLRADLCLRIAAAHQQKPSAFTMELRIQPPPAPTFEEKLAAAEASPASVSCRTFSGSVSDPSGAGIPGVLISIYKHSSGIAARPRKIRSDKLGHFSVAPSPGRYTAVFSDPGLEPQFLTFEIAREAVQNSVYVKLNIGAMSEVVAVAAKNSSR